MITGLLLGFAAGATVVGLVLNRKAFDWEGQRQMMEAGMVRIFERRLGMPAGTGRAALETWKAHGYGLARFAGVEATKEAFDPEP